MGWIGFILGVAYTLIFEGEHFRRFWFLTWTSVANLDLAYVAQIAEEPAVKVPLIIFGAAGTLVLLRDFFAPNREVARMAAQAAKRHERRLDDFEADLEKAKRERLARENPPNRIP